MRPFPPFVFLVIAWFAISSCGGDAGPDGLSFEVTEDGPFRAGYRTMTIQYASFDGATREIEVAVWYPTLDQHIDEGGPNDTTSPRYSFVADPATIVDASPAAPAYPGGYPVVVHSHGHYGFPGNSYHLATALARHGFVVVAPEHVDDTLADVTTPTPFRNYIERALDVSAALDALEVLPPTDPLAGSLVLDRVVITGHSRGTYTVFAMSGAELDAASMTAMCDGGSFTSGGGCTAEEIARLAQGFADPRVVAGIPMAGTGDRGFYGASGQNVVTAPLLLMTGSEDDVGAQALFDDLTDVDLRWVDIAGGCHQLYGFGLCPSITDEVGQPIVRAYALAFARRHLFDDATPTVLGILDGTYVVSDLASLKQ